MEEICPSCGEKSSSWEESEQICTNCGLVRATNGLVAEAGLYQENETKSDDVKYHISMARRYGCPKIPQGKKNGRKTVRRVALSLDCSSMLIEEAQKLYDQTFDHVDFHYRKMLTKDIIASCCVYIICRQHSWPVTLTDVCRFAKCSVGDLEYWKRRIVSAFNIEISSVDLLELVEIQCRKLDFSVEIQRRASEIIKLSRDAWISDGRKPECVIVAACYVAWMSEDPVKNRKITLPKFCRDKKITHTRAATNLFGRIMDTIHILAEQIPWVNKIDQFSVALYIKDVLSYRKTLLADALMNSKEEDESGSESEEIISGAECTSALPVLNSEIIPPLQSTSGNNFVASDYHWLKEEASDIFSCIQMPESSSAKIGGTDQRDVVTETENIGSQDAVIITGIKRKMKDRFIPCTYRDAWEKHHKSTHSENDVGSSHVGSLENIDREEIGEFDIPESDLHNYIKSEKEINTVMPI